MVGFEWLVSTRVAADIAALVFVKGTVLLVSMIAIGYAARKCSAAFRHRVWLLGLIGLLTLLCILALSSETAVLNRVRVG